MKKGLLMVFALVTVLGTASRAEAFGFRLGPEFLFQTPGNETLMAFGFDSDFHIVGPLNFHTSGLLGFNGDMMTWDALLGLKLKFPVAAVVLLGIRGDFVMRGQVPFSEDSVYNSGFALGGAITPELGFRLGRFELFVDVELQIFKYVYPDDVFVDLPSDEVQYALSITPGFRF